MSQQISQPIHQQAEQPTPTWPKVLVVFLGFYAASAVAIKLLEMAGRTLVGATLQTDIMSGGLVSFAAMLLGALLLSLLLTRWILGPAFLRLPYPVLTALVFTGFYAVGMILIAATGIGILYTMPQWAVIGQLADSGLHSVVSTPVDLRGEWYSIGTVLYALLGLGIGLFLEKHTVPQARLVNLVTALALVQLLICGSLLVLGVLGIYDPMKNF